MGKVATTLVFYMKTTPLCLWEFELWSEKININKHQSQWCDFASSLYKSTTLLILTYILQKKECLHFLNILHSFIDVLLEAILWLQSLPKDLALYPIIV